MEFDKDLAARQEARSLCRRAKMAQKQLSALPQEKLNSIVEAVAQAFAAAAEGLAKLAVEETALS